MRSVNNIKAVQIEQDNLSPLPSSYFKTTASIEYSHIMNEALLTYCPKCHQKSQDVFCEIRYVVQPSVRLQVHPGGQVQIVWRTVETTC